MNLNSWHYRLIIWSAIISALSYLVIILLSEWKDVFIALKQVGISGIFIALTLSLVNYLLRFFRWQMYLISMNCEISFWLNLRIYIAGFALTATPGKSGEMIRGLLLKPYGVKLSKSLSAFLSERLSDLLAILILALFGLTSYPKTQVISIAGLIVVLLFFFLVSSNFFLGYLYLKIRKKSYGFLFLRKVFKFLVQVRNCHNPFLIIKASVLSLIAWTAEAFALYTILLFLDVELNISFVIFIYAISMLAGAISFIPGGLGATEAVMISILIWKGVGKPEAVASTLIIRLTTLWFAVVLGVISLSFFKK